MFELSDTRRDELVEQWAQKIVQRGFAIAAVFLLESHKPLAGIGANLTIAVQPLLAPLVSMNLDELAAFMNKPRNVELLMERIESLEHEREATASAARARQSEVRRRARRIARLRRQRRRSGDAR